MAISEKPPAGKKFFSLAEANKTLPLVKAIVGDISALAHSMRERYQALEDSTGDAKEQIEDSLSEDQDRLQTLVDELTELGVELKDFFTGLADFPCWKNGREIYLCWKLDEPTIGHWHEVWAGFSGRREIGRAHD